MTLAFAGLVAGFVHVLSGPDHLAAIAPYAVDGKSRAWRTGVRWGLGHARECSASGSWCWCCATRCRSRPCPPGANAWWDSP